MNVLRVRNVHRALPLAVEMLRVSGVRRSSRNGDVFQSEHPVSTVYAEPLERVMFWPERDANPFFHFFESLWMLGGCNDVTSVQRFAGQMGAYSDDGETFHAAYGYRWRVGMPSGNAVNHAALNAHMDQLPRIAASLRDNPLDRRQVLQMWNSLSDLNSQSKDLPCNTTATFQTSPSGQLCLVVFNRSNDIIWGCYGANAVQFSTLLEYVARRAELPVGTYTQVSVNWHGYDATFTPLLHKFQTTAMQDVPEEARDGDITSLIEEDCPYATGQARAYPLMSPDTDPDAWDQCLRHLLASKGRAPVAGRWQDDFFVDVAIPILQAHDVYKDTADETRYEQALKRLEKCRASDWRLACSEWITRRWSKARNE